MRNLVRNLCLTILLVPVGIALATNPPAVQWTRTFGGDKQAAGRVVARTSDGGYVVAGLRDSSVSGAFVVKTDSYGQSQWERFLVGGGEGTMYSVLQAVDGGYALAGDIGAREGVIKLDANGNEVWRSRYFDGDSFITYGASMRQRADGSYVIAGAVEPRYEQGIGSTAGYYLVKLDSTGRRCWRRVYAADVDEATSVVVCCARDGGYVLCGGDGAQGLRLVKTDSSGTLLWSRTYVSSQLGDGRDVIQVADGAYVIAGGAVENAHAYQLDMYLAKTDSQGGLLWVRKYDHSTSERANCVVLTDDGGYLVAGTTWSEGAGDEACVVRTNADGVAVWSTSFGQGNGTEAWDAVQSPDGGYVVAGEGYDGAAGARMFLLKLMPDRH